ncbi:MFS transporter, partial [Streptomyces kebangsaanensis]|uniref:MFS transporter n=1 Tax=Streptomyces kebangsaanensis TaxID=864058 RepID=UPI002D219FFB
SAAAAVVAGRLVERFGRLLTVWGLVTVLAGLAVTALVLRTAPPGTMAWLAAPALFVGGLGSGCVISPNVTMTLRDVPVRMAGAAGGALQTGQRLGGAVGTAALPGLYYMVLAADGRNYRTAVTLSVASALVALLAALAVALLDWRRDRHHRDRHGPRQIRTEHSHAGHG